MDQKQQYQPQMYTSPQKQVVPFDFVIFTYEQGKYESKITIKDLEQSGLIKEVIQQQQQTHATEPLTLNLPKWLNKQIFDIFYDYLQSQQLPVWTNKLEHLTDQALQRLLWVGDYFQMDKYQSKIIKEVLIPRIRDNNCVMILNEAFKKLKACEDSQDIWYMLLNTGMNYTAKHLIDIYVNQKQDMSRINPKILEEIIERTLKYAKNKAEFRIDEMVNILLFVREKQNIIDLLQLQHKQVTQKKINYNNHPSISWKLQKIDTLQNKETNRFKFNDYNWKLVAKMENIKILSESPQKKEKTLKIYLRLDKETVEQAQISNTEHQKIIAIYFQLKINDTDIQQLLQIKHIIVEKQNQILLCQFYEQDFEKYRDKKLEFTVYLNTDYQYSMLLNHFAQKWTSYNTISILKNMNQDDLEVVVMAQPNNQIESEKIFQLGLNWVRCRANRIDFNSLMKSFNYKQVSQSFLLELLSNQTVKQYSEIQKYIESEIERKKEEQNNDTYQRYTQSRNTHDFGQKNTEFNYTSKRDNVVSSTSLEHQPYRPITTTDKNQQKQQENYSPINYQKRILSSSPKQHQLKSNLAYTEYQKQSDTIQNHSQQFNRENIHKTPKNQENLKRQRLLSEQESQNIQPNPSFLKNVLNQNQQFQQKVEQSQDNVQVNNANSRIGYSPNKHIMLAGVQTNFSNDQVSGSASVDVSKHSKSGIVQLGNHFSNQDPNKQNSNSALKVPMSSNNSNSQINTSSSNLPCNKLDKLKKSTSNQKGPVELQSNSEINTLQSSALKSTGSFITQALQDKPQSNSNLQLSQNYGTIGMFNFHPSSTLNSQTLTQSQQSHSSGQRFNANNSISQSKNLNSNSQLNISKKGTGDSNSNSRGFFQPNIPKIQREGKKVQILSQLDLANFFRDNREGNKLKQQFMQEKQKMQLQQQRYQQVQ